MYELIGTKWGSPTIGTPSGTINWDADLGGLPTPASTGELMDALSAAFVGWESVAALDFAQGGAIDLTITYASFSTDGDPDNNGAAATAEWSGSGEPVNSVITFNSDLSWAPYGSGGTNFFAVALHEIGHIIGLDHVSDPTQIMNDTIYANNLGSGDIEGAQYLYGIDGDDVPASEGPSVASSGGGGGGGAAGLLGLLVGLIAVLTGMFTGGAGAAVAMAAGRVASNDDEEEAEVGGDHLHTAWIEVPPLPMIDFEPTPMVEDEDVQESFFL